jgi:predicted aldo/keto reductase-like oxidoreductase
MNEKHVSRRNFIKAAGIAGVGSAIGAGQALAQAGAPPTGAAAPAAPVAKVATRPFGKTGVKVPILALGGIFDITMNQLVLQRALDFGVTYWDTANSYNGGKSETGIGMFFEKNPNIRKEIFLVTKSGDHSPGGMTRHLDESLQRMQTDHVDLFFLHGLKDGNRLTNEVKAWAATAKASKKIRFFGLSTHENMEECLLAAARAGWIDGIMLKYDYRLMHEDNMRAAMDACEKAGIGLTAMKTQSKEPIKTETEADLKLGGYFVKRGFTEHQARLKAVWENPQIASICSAMTNVTVLTANVAAALDKTKLTAADHAVLREYAEATRSRHCAGCTHFCEAALGNQVPVGDMMRALMYHRSYGDQELARTVFNQLPETARRGLGGFNYAAAERACPHNLPIAQLMREAGELLA